jgi:hypothetical protein
MQGVGKILKLIYKLQNREIKENASPRDSLGMLTMI